jgi:hypothetical protein
MLHLQLKTCLSCRSLWGFVIGVGVLFTPVSPGLLVWNVPVGMPESGPAVRSVAGTPAEIPAEPVRPPVNALPGMDFSDSSDSSAALGMAIAAGWEQVEEEAIATLYVEHYESRSSASSSADGITSAGLPSEHRASVSSSCGAVSAGAGQSGPVCRVVDAGGCHDGAVKSDTGCTSAAEDRGDHLSLSYHSIRQGYTDPADSANHVNEKVTRSERGTSA